MRAAVRPKFVNPVADTRSFGVWIVATHHGGCSGEEPGVFRLQRVNSLLLLAAVAPSPRQVGSQLANGSRQPLPVSRERRVLVGADGRRVWCDWYWVALRGGNAPRWAIQTIVVRSATIHNASEG